LIRALPALLLAAALLTPGAALAGTERFAVVVGSNAGGAGAGPLYFAELDAERVADVLEQLGGVPADHLTVLRSPTRAGFDAAMERLGERVAEVKADGGHATVFFYFSGHADPDAIQLGRQTVLFADLRAALEATGADVRLLFIDSCYAGAATRTKGARRAPGFLEATAEVDASGEVLIASSAADELSQESDEVGGSYFTHYLLSGLRGAADASGDGTVTLDEAYRYVYHRTVAHTAATRAGTQHPGYDYDLSGSGDVVLTTLGARGATLSFDERQSGRFLIFDEDDDRFVAEVQVTPGRPTRLAVEAGAWRVQKRAPDALYEQVLTLGPGDEGAVDADRMKSMPYSEDVTKGSILRARRWAAGREIGLNARFGVQSFFDEAIRKTLVPPMPLAGLEVDVRGFLGPVLSLRADALVGAMEHTPFPDVPARLTEVHAGVGLFLTPRIPGARALRPFVGARVGLIWIHREFLPPLIQPSQDYAMAAPGIAGGLTIAPDRRFRLGLEARTHLMLYVDDGEQQALGYFEGLMTVGIAL